jgi:hypothetical protein
VGKMLMELDKLQYLEVLVLEMLENKAKVLRIKKAEHHKVLRKNNLYIETQSNQRNGVTFI